MVFKMFLLGLALGHSVIHAHGRDEKITRTNFATSYLANFVAADKRDFKRHVGISLFEVFKDCFVPNDGPYAHRSVAKFQYLFRSEANPGCAEGMLRRSSRDKASYGKIRLSVGKRGVSGAITDRDSVHSRRRPDVLPLSIENIAFNNAVVSVTLKSPVAKSYPGAELVCSYLRSDLVCFDGGIGCFRGGVSTCLREPQRLASLPERQSDGDQTRKTQKRSDEPYYDSLLSRVRSAPLSAQVGGLVVIGLVTAIGFTIGVWGIFLGRNDWRYRRWYWLSLLIGVGTYAAFGWLIASPG